MFPFRNCTKKARLLLNQGTELLHFFLGELATFVAFITLFSSQVGAHDHATAKIDIRFCSLCAEQESMVIDTRIVDIQQETFPHLLNHFITNR